MNCSTPNYYDDGLQNFITEERNELDNQKELEYLILPDTTELDLQNHNEAELVLSDCKIRKLKLGKLNISYCDLNKLPNLVCGFKYLTELNLSNNSLENLPEGVMNLRNLLWLNLSDNKLSFLPKSLRYIHQLIYINLSNNRFFEVPDVLYCGLRNIKILDLSFNDISKFIDPPECLNKIIELRLSNNSLESLPVWIFHYLCQLQILDLSDNPLTSNSKPVVTYYNSGIFESLKILKIENCNYSYDGLEYLSYFTNLEILCIGKQQKSKSMKKGQNYLGNLKMGVFKNLKKIKSLYIENVLISTLPVDFDCLKKVETISLAQNMLSWLPESTCNFGNLKYLNLSFNQLLFLPNDIYKLENLQQIHLQDNRLSELPNSFYELHNLEYIDIYNNKLEDIDVKIFEINTLKGIDLELNQLDINFKYSFGDIDELKKKYNHLKNSFRTHFNCLSDRLDCQKAKCPSSSEDLSHESSPSSARHSVSFCESDTCSESENFNIPIKQHNKAVEDNDWDEVNSYEIEEDAFFDPNKEDCLNSRLNTTWGANFRNNYCPANNHVQSIMRTCLRNYRSASRNGAVVEGQFDSD